MLLAGQVQDAVGAGRAAAQAAQLDRDAHRQRRREMEGNTHPRKGITSLVNSISSDASHDQGIRLPDSRARVRADDACDLIARPLAAPWRTGVGGAAIAAACHSTNRPCMHFDNHCCTTTALFITRGAVEHGREGVGRGRPPLWRRWRPRSARAASDATRDSHSAPRNAHPPALVQLR